MENMEVKETGQGGVGNTSGEVHIRKSGKKGGKTEKKESWETSCFMVSIFSMNWRQDHL